MDSRRSSSGERFHRAQDPQMTHSLPFELSNAEPLAHRKPRQEFVVAEVALAVEAS
jgi:hypothetical protein